MENVFSIPTALPLLCQHPLVSSMERQFERNRGDNDPCFFRTGGKLSVYEALWAREESFIGTARRLGCQPAGTGTADAPLSPAVPRGWIMGGALLSHQEIPSGCHGGGAKRHNPSKTRSTQIFFLFYLTVLSHHRSFFYLFDYQKQ